MNGELDWEDDKDPIKGINRILDDYYRDTLPSYYSPVKENIGLTSAFDRGRLNQDVLKQHYLNNIGNVDELVQNVLRSSDAESLEAQINILQRMGSSNIEDVKSRLDSAIEGEMVDRLRGHVDQETINRLADYEVSRRSRGLGLYPTALLAGGIGASIAGLDPLQSLGTGIAATAAIPVTDAILNANPSLRKYKAVTGIRPAAAAITGILTALGFKTLSPEQEQQLLDRGMQYAQQSGGMG
jgi:hypothetical protein